MFWAAAAFNQPIGAWDTSAVIDMSRMVWAAAAFNLPIGAWNSSTVTTMRRMFGDAAALTSPSVHGLLLLSISPLVHGTPRP